MELLHIKTSIVSDTYHLHTLHEILKLNIKCEYYVHYSEIYLTVTNTAMQLDYNATPIHDTFFYGVQKALLTSRYHLVPVSIQHMVTELSSGWMLKHAA